MVDNDRSKLQLESDVRLLYNLLERAKKERKSYHSTVLRLQKSVAASNARAAEVDNVCNFCSTTTKFVRVLMLVPASCLFNATELIRSSGNSRLTSPRFNCFDILVNPHAFSSPA